MKQQTEANKIYRKQSTIIYKIKILNKDTIMQIRQGMPSKKHMEIKTNWN